MIKRKKEIENLGILEEWWGIMMNHLKKEFNFSKEETVFRTVRIENSYVFMVHPRIHKLLRKCFREKNGKLIPEKKENGKIYFRGTRKIILNCINCEEIMSLFKELPNICRAKIKQEREREIAKLKKKLKNIENEANLILSPIYLNFKKSTKAFLLKNNPPEKRYCLSIKTKKGTARKKNGLFDVKIFGSSPKILTDNIRRMYEIE